LKTTRFLLRPTTNLGFLSQTFRANRLSDPRKYILKVGTGIPQRRKWAKELHVFDRELAAYRLLAPLKGKYSPRLFAGISANQGSDGLLLLEEIRNARNLDQLRGLSWTQLTSAIRTIAHIHAYFWNSPALKKTKGLPHHHYMRAHKVKQNLPAFLRWAKLSPRDRQPFTKLTTQVPAIMARFRKRPLTLVHGDLRSDNVFYKQTSVRFIDWGLASAGNPTFDLARFAGGSARKPLSLLQHVDLFTLWHRELLRRGVRNYPSHEAWQDYRDAVLLALTIPVTNSPTLANFSNRGHKLAKVMTKRFFFAARVINHE
jgi:aminoglycoside phosphotransferase (APT) family kinase protein